MKATPSNLSGDIKADATHVSWTPAKAPLRSVLIIAQVALSLVLLVGAALFVRTLQRGLTLETGIDSARTVWLSVNSLAGKDSDDAAVVSSQDLLLEHIRAKPGVRDAGLATRVPMMGVLDKARFQIEGRDSTLEHEGTPLAINYVSANFFDVLGIPLIQGRMFRQDEIDSGQSVVVITENLARQLWPSSQPIGRRIRSGNSGPWHEIIGTIRNTSNLAAYEDEAQLYFPYSQAARRDLKFIVATRGNPRHVTADLLKRAQASHPNSLIEAGTLQDGIPKRLRGEKALALISSTIGLLALGLAVTGLYGVLAWQVTERTREIGIRIAVGADRNSVLRLTLRQGMRLVIIGAGIGLICMVGLSPFLKSLIYDLSPLDPVSTLGACFLLGMTALAGCWFPARRAANVDPIIALRAE